MLLRLRALGEAFRNSLFHFPSLFVVLAVALWRAMLSLDAVVGRDRLPEVVRFSEETAGPLLATIGATITVAGIVFSVTVVAVQLASSQFSLAGPAGLPAGPLPAGSWVVGTSTYAMLALGSSAPPTPHLTLAVAVVLAMLQRELLAVGLDRRIGILRSQAALVVEESRRSSASPVERERVRRVAAPLLGLDVTAGNG